MVATSDLAQASDVPAARAGILVGATELGIDVTERPWELDVEALVLPRNSSGARGGELTRALEASAPKRWSEIEAMIADRLDNEALSQDAPVLVELVPSHLPSRWRIHQLLLATAFVAHASSELEEASELSAQASPRTGATWRRRFGKAVGGFDGANTEVLGDHILATTAIVEAAARAGIRSFALPLLGAGAGGQDQLEAVRKMMVALRRALPTTQIKRVIIVDRTGEIARAGVLRVFDGGPDIVRQYFEFRDIDFDVDAAAFVEEVAQLLRGGLNAGPKLNSERLLLLGLAYVGTTAEARSKGAFAELGQRLSRATGLSWSDLAAAMIKELRRRATSSHNRIEGFTANASAMLAAMLPTAARSAGRIELNAADIVRGLVSAPEGSGAAQFIADLGLDVTGLRAGSNAEAVSAAETVNAHVDDPAVVDELGRKPFAEVLAARIDEVWRKRPRTRGPSGPVGGDAFMVHIHGPWGAGKSSVLNFLASALQLKRQPPTSRWVVVDFNAWRHARLQPPWWALTREIYRQAAAQLGRWPRTRLRAHWFAWRFRADWLPTTLAIGCALLALVLGASAVGLVDLFGAEQPQAVDTGGGTAVATAVPNEAADSSKAASPNEKVAASIDSVLKVFTALLAVSGAIFGFSRSLVFGSNRAAATYAEARSDPYAPIVKLFGRLVHAVRCPIVVFIDDVDRCDAAYVVDLLEGIQTLMRGAPITYIVVADRSWICASFEKKYDTFGTAIAEPGRPLGHLFLDKLFQISVAVPTPTAALRARYWGRLLGAAPRQTPADYSKIAEAERDAAVRVKDAVTQEQLQNIITDSVGDPVQEEAVRAAAAKQITSARAAKATEHRLQGYADLLEPNPRAMKRLVNAYGLYQASQFLEGKSAPIDPVVRWTIVQLRWPLLAEYLQDNPSLLVVPSAAAGDPHPSVPSELVRLLREPAVRAVLHAPPGAGLDEAALRALLA